MDTVDTAPWNHRYEGSERYSPRYPGTRRRTYFVLMLAARYWAQIVARSQELNMLRFLLSPGMSGSALHR
jgi:hypothetical protein